MSKFEILPKLLKTAKNERHQVFLGVYCSSQGNNNLERMMSYGK